MEDEELVHIVIAIINSYNNEHEMGHVLERYNRLTDASKVNVLLMISKRLNIVSTSIKQLNLRELIKLKIWFAKVSLLTLILIILILTITIITNGDINNLMNSMKHAYDISDVIFSSK